MVKEEPISSLQIGNCPCTFWRVSAPQGLTTKDLLWQ